MKYLLNATLLLMSMPVFAGVISFSRDRSPSSVNVNEAEAFGAHVHEIDFKINKVIFEDHALQKEMKTFSEKNINFSQTVGSPRLPFKSVVVVGKPDEIIVTVDPRDSFQVALLSTPAQEEDCRCPSDKTKKWTSYQTNKKNDLYKVEYLGKYRGEDLSRVTVWAAQTDFRNSSTLFYPKLSAQIQSKKSIRDALTSSPSSEYDYLIVTPRELLPGLRKFVTYKKKEGLTLKVVILEDIGKDVPKLTKFFKEEYAAYQYKYALLVGTEKLLPTHLVHTQGSPKTPSDYTYFLMDSADLIPDVQYGRVVASTSSEVEKQTERWMDYQDHTSPFSQYLQMIGIASNEGQNPSDDEYVKEIEHDMNAGFNTEATHFYQDSSTSTPKFINEALNAGVGFLVYMGHGSGTSWGSTGTQYSTSDIAKIDNAENLKPFIVDIACMNGSLTKGFFLEKHC